MNARRIEAQRDQTDSAFTPILRRLFESVSALQFAVFVDVEGESIDYVSVLDPYEAKVAAAHMHMLLGTLRAMRVCQRLGDPFGFELVAARREVFVRRLGDDYVLIAMLTPGYDRSLLRDALALAAREFRSEVGLAVPAWETPGDRLSVRVRASPGWQYAPDGFSVGGARVPISDVLGRWIEASAADGSDLVCFRVRTLEGRELTLVHDEPSERWWVRD